MWQRLILLILWLPLLVLAAKPPATLQEADELFEKARYEEALTIYRKLFSGGTKESQLKSQYRAAECEALLFRYGEAVSSVLRLPTFPDPKWRVRFGILKVELSRLFLAQYGHFSPKEKEIGNQDVTRKTQKEWKEEIEKHFDELWKDRKFAKQFPLAKENDFIQTQDTDLARIPTLWDFVVLRWSQHLSKHGDSALSQHSLADLLKAAPPSALHSQNVRLKQAYLFEEASQGNSGLRSTAQELWKLERLRLLSPYISGDGSSFSLAQKKEALRYFEKQSSLFHSVRAKSESLSDLASLKEKLNQYPEAIEICEGVKKKYPNTIAADKCYQTIASIKAPELTITSQPFSPNTAPKIAIKARNLKNIHFRIFPITVDELRQRSAGYDRESWASLRWLSQSVIESVLKKTPLHQINFTLLKENKYERIHREALKFPTLPKGLYIAVASSDDSFQYGRSLLQGILLNATDLILIASAGLSQSPGVVAPKSPQTATGIHTYVANALTGVPVPQATLETFWREGGQKTERILKQTNPEGMATLETTFARNPIYHSYDLAAFKDGAISVLETPLSFTKTFPSRIQIFIESDRPIYRPEQKATFKVTVVQRTNDGFQVLRKGSSLKFQIVDTQGQEIHKSSLTLNSYGSASVSTTLPGGRLMGNYRAIAELTDEEEKFTQEFTFPIEEFLRPEFEITLKDARAPWKYGNKATIEGNVHYFFGANAKGAILNYRIYQRATRPWFCWWWPQLPDESNKEIKTGTLTTDSNGDFTFAFIPPLPSQSEQHTDNKHFPSQFTVEVEARESGGRTLKNSRTYLAAAQSYLFDASFENGFLTAEKENKLTLRALTFNEQEIPTEGTLSLHRLSGTGNEIFSHDFQFSREQNLQTLYQDTKNGELLFKRSFKTTLDKTPAPLVLPSLPEGIYRMTLQGKDDRKSLIEQKIILAILPDILGPITTSVAHISLAQTTEVPVGNTTKIAFGSSLIKTNLFLETWVGDTLESKEVLSGGVHVKSFTALLRHRGGVTFRWFGVNDHQVRHGEIHLNIPWKEKTAKLNLKVSQNVTPGQLVSLELLASDRSGRGLTGEATVRVYDRALEYYQRAQGQWSSGLYSSSPWPLPFSFPAETLHASHLPFDFDLYLKTQGLGTPQSSTTIPGLPSLRCDSSQHWGTYGGSTNRRSRRMRPMVQNSISSETVPSIEVGSVTAPAAALSQPQLKETGVLEPFPSLSTGVGLSSKTSPAPRTNFNETAYFNPQLEVKNGKGTAEWRFPETLTSWRIETAFLTQDTIHAEETETVQTRKEFMARLELPRFVRENDSLTIKGVLHNETEQAMDGKAVLTITSATVPRVAPLVGTPEKSIKIPPKSSSIIEWKIEVPNGIGDYQVTIDANASIKLQKTVFQDSQLRKLPVLPSRQRLISSQVIALKSGSATLVPSRLKKNDIKETTFLQIDPQLLLPILNGLPLLLNTPFENTEAVLNRFLPLAILQKLYEKYPALQKAVAEIPKRKTISPLWDRNDPRRLLSLLETPWNQKTLDSDSNFAMTDLFDPKTVAMQEKASLEALERYQSPSGGFPWIPGGKEDLFMTLYVLQGFQTAKTFGIEIPEKLIKQSFGYVMSEISTINDISQANLSMLLFASYTLSSYYENYPWAKDLLPHLQKWLALSDKHANAMTVLGKAYAAHAYASLNENEKSKDYLDRALDGAKEDPVTGVYWQPEKTSWLWYHDSLETHAFLLRTLLKFRPNDKKIPGIIQWILFHRKANEWDSTKAAAAAVLALIDALEFRNELNQAATFSLAWGGLQENIQLAPMEWIKKPLRWEKKADDSSLPVTLTNTSPTLLFASLSTIFSSNDPAPQNINAPLQLERKFFRVKTQKGSNVLFPLNSGDAIKLGDKIQVQLKFQSKSQMEYLHLKSPKGAGFEAETIRSGWHWDKLNYYEEPRDSLNNFFIPWLPHGEFVLTYTMRASTTGSFQFGPAVLTSLYAPDIASYSKGFSLTILPD